MAVIAPAHGSSRVTGAGAADSVLIGFADALAAPEVAWSLLESGVRVTVFARRGSRPPIRRCRGVKVVEVTPPERDIEATLAELQALVEDGGYGAVMPLNDPAVWICSRLAARDSSVAIAGPTGSCATLALDKRLQLEAAARAGFKVPPTLYAETVADVLTRAENLPLALKPARPVINRGGRLVRDPNHACGDRAELQDAARRWDGAGAMLVQPLIDGVGTGLFGLAGRDGLLALSAHQRVRMMNPQGSGSSACASIAVDPELARCAERMLGDAGWHGMFMLEFLRDRDGIPWFMELNGRPWGSMALARRTGLEYPAWAIRQLVEPEFVPVLPPLPEGQVCRHLGRELVHLMMVLRGPKSVALTNWPSRRRTLREVLRVGRSDDWYNLRRSDWRVFLDDAICTVRTEVFKKARV